MSIRTPNRNRGENAGQSTTSAARDGVADARKSHEPARRGSGMIFDETRPLVEIGLVLRQAREARALPLRDVAAHTNIFERHLRALEIGAMPKVAHTFARGYLKNYAQFLRLDADFLLASFDRATRPAPAEETVAETEPQGSTPLAQRLADNQLLNILKSGLRRVAVRRSSWSSGSWRSPVNLIHAMTSAALPLLLLCAVAFTYYSIDADRLESEEVVLASLAPPDVHPEQLGPLASEAIAASTGAEQPASSSPAAAERLVAASTEPAGVTAPEPSSAENTASSPMPAAYPADLQTGDTRPGSALAANTTSQVRAAGVITVGSDARTGQLDRSNRPGDSIEDAFEPVGPGAVQMISRVRTPDRLVITVYEDSWIDVRDNSGARLYRNLARAGKRIDVSGELPFALHVGNVPGLEMRLNGEPVEITRYRSDNSARLTLASN